MEQKYVKDEELGIHIPVMFLKDNTAAPYYILNDPISDRAAGLWSCNHELNECHEYLNFLKIGLEMESSSEVAKKTLFISAVMTYMKCFNDGEGRSVQLQYDRVYKGNEKMLEYHFQLKDLRNKVFGHRGIHPVVSNKTVVYFYPPQIDFDHIETKVSVTNLSYDHSVERFIELIERSKEYIDKELEELHPIFIAKVRSMDIEEMYANSKIPDIQKII
jgi:hypothetical protein